MKYFLIVATLIVVLWVGYSFSYLEYVQSEHPTVIEQLKGGDRGEGLGRTF